MNRILAGRRLRTRFDVVATGVESETLSNYGHFLFHLAWRLVCEVDELRGMSGALQNRLTFKFKIYVSVDPAVNCA